jgi:hypothetical protein
MMTSGVNISGKPFLKQKKCHQYYPGGTDYVLQHIVTEANSQNQSQ